MRGSSAPSKTSTSQELAVALEAARALGRALGESPVFERFEAAYDAFQSDTDTRRRLEDYQARQQEVRLAAMWGGADPLEQEYLEREWRSLSALPTLAGYLRGQNQLRIMLREVTGKISAETGVDYGAACSPSGGCC